MKNTITIQDTDITEIAPYLDDLKKIYPTYLKDFQTKYEATEKVFIDHLENTYEQIQNTPFLLKGIASKLVTKENTLYHNVKGEKQPHYDWEMKAILQENKEQELKIHFSAIIDHLQERKKQLEKERNKADQPTELTGNQQDEKEKPKEPPFYVKIGALFAQGCIKKSKSYFYLTENNTDTGTEKETMFTTVSDLARAVQSMLGTKKQVRQYINHTLNHQGTKNFYDSKRMMEKINLYCEENGIKTTPEFKERFDKITY
ncbi:hypothetical protein [Marinilabilia rubra]|uniref:Uncharacterized protein n=1 Tax=Marinilabilia rubra TaxID=2162893 RepID=A0A2U2BD55_9BACT|nr:hypothetical protein [Marinilabilia rubra]PWE00998.1 hypothetical protein DDZ16_00480 [Marinilabilia rubra]